MSVVVDGAAMSTSMTAVCRWPLVGRWRVPVVYTSIVCSRSWNIYSVLGLVCVFVWARALGTWHQIDGEGPRAANGRPRRGVDFGGSGRNRHRPGRMC